MNGPGLEGFGQRRARMTLLGRVTAMIAEIDQLERDMKAWNEQYRPPGSEPIAWDPDGSLARWRGQWIKVKAQLEAAGR